MTQARSPGCGSRPARRGRLPGAGGTQRPGAVAAAPLSGPPGPVDNAVRSFESKLQLARARLARRCAGSRRLRSTPTCRRRRAGGASVAAWARPRLRDTAGWQQGRPAARRHNKLIAPRAAACRARGGVGWGRGDKGRVCGEGRACGRNSAAEIRLCSVARQTWASVPRPVPALPVACCQCSTRLGQPAGPERQGRDQGDGAGLPKGTGRAGVCSFLCRSRRRATGSAADPRPDAPRRTP